MASHQEPSGNDPAKMTLKITTLPSRQNDITNWEISTDDETIYTPTTSENTSSDEMMNTPTTLTPLLFVPNSNLSGNDTSGEQDSIVPTPTNPKYKNAASDDQHHIRVGTLGEPLEDSLPSLRPDVASDIPYSESVSSNADEVWCPEFISTDEIWDPNATLLAANAGMTDAEADSFNMQAMAQAITTSKVEYITRAEQASIDRAIAESQGIKADYLPANREQSRIMTAYVEDLTAEKSWHTEDDESFFSRNSRGVRGGRGR